MKKNKNPFDRHILYHYKLAYQVIPKKNIKILDLGSGNGDFANSLLRKTNTVSGYDVSETVIKKATKKYKKVRFVLGKPNRKLPFRNSTFDIVVLFHVLEHVVSEDELLKEIARILKKDGRLLLASPYKGMLTWMDLANMRYTFPRIHKALYTAMWGRVKYGQMFSQNTSEMFGDSTKGNNWHKHYTQEELSALLNKRFAIEKIEKFSFFHPILNIVNIIDSVIRRKDFLPVPWITEILFYLDNRLMVGDFSYNFFLIARKK